MQLSVLLFFSVVLSPHLLHDFVTHRFNLVLAFHLIALEEEGIFRKSGNSVEVEALKLLYDSKRGEIDLSFYSPHTISSLVKSYIRQLPEPLFTFALYDGFIDANISECDEGRLKEFKKLINRLPKRNAAILRFLFLSLQKYVSHSSKNMMISSNLAIVFAPNLLRAEKETYQQVVFHSSALNAIVTTMIEKAELLFDSVRTPFLLFLHLILTFLHLRFLTPELSRLC
jgi:hypothetical protein